MQADAQKSSESIARPGERWYNGRMNATRAKANHVRTDVCILVGLAALVALAFLVRALIKRDRSEQVIIRYGSEQILSVPLSEDCTIVLRDGTVAEEQTGEGKENVLVIQNGGVTMVSSTCPGCDCQKQGTVTSDNRDTRPLGRWIVCAPHRVSVEVTGEGEA